jgi:hypothetical protein
VCTVYCIVGGGKVILSVKEGRGGHGSRTFAETSVRLLMAVNYFHVMG